MKAIDNKDSGFSSQNPVCADIGPHSTGGPLL